MDGIADTELLRRASRGDGAAFEAFYRRHVVIVHLWFARRVGDVADDLTGETFAAALLGVRRFRGEHERAAAAWLYTIAGHQLARYLRTREADDRGRRALGIAIERDAPIWDADELDERLTAAIGSLPPEQQAVVRLRVLADLEYTDVGRALGCSPATARQRLARALRRLRSELAEGPS